MDNDFIGKVKSLLRTITESGQDFYRNKYRHFGARFLEDLDEEKFRSIPSVTKQEIAEAPYRSRCYGERSGMHKLIFSEETDAFFLLHRMLEEIREDALPPEGLRSMVALSNAYEAIERCLFFYEKTNCRSSARSETPSWCMPRRSNIGLTPFL